VTRIDPIFFGRPGSKVAAGIESSFKRSAIATHEAFANEVLTHTQGPKDEMMRFPFCGISSLKANRISQGLDLLPEKPARFQGTAFPMVAILIYQRIIEATAVVHIRGGVEIETKLKSESNTETMVCHCLDISRVSAAFVVASFWLMVLCQGRTIGHDAHVGEIVRGHSDRTVNTE
jgi:hypothetical protein